ncbi:MAG: globin-coupled sensor protein [Sporolactobacillus sp.]|nr:globin-coupled sensor protein [Sporolactobacillus sp.]
MKLIGKKPLNDWQAQVAEATATIRVTDPKTLDKLNMLNLTTTDLRWLKLMRPYIRKQIEGIAHDFYAKFSRIDRLKTIIERYSSIEKLSRTLAMHVMDFFAGTIDNAFIERRVRVGKMHFRIGLTPSDYMGAFNQLQSAISHIVRQTVGEDHRSAQRIIRAVTKIICFEQQVVLEVYDSEYQRKLNGEYEKGRREISAGVAQMAENLSRLGDETSAAVGDLQGRFTRARVSARNGSSESNQVKLQAAEGKTQLDQLLKQMERIKQSTGDMRQAVADLTDSSQKIARVTDMVKQVAEQTHILALNSAIEAARAGEYGKGFNVVADEIRKLAEETNKAMTQISERIAHGSKLTANVATSIGQIVEMIKTSTVAFEQMDRKFSEIIAAIDRSSKLSGEVDAATDGVAVVANRLDRGMKAMSDSLETLKSNL